MTVSPARSESASTRMTVDSTSLFVSSGINALLGLVFWVATTRLYPVEEVGRASTLVNSAVLLASLSNAGLGAMYERFLPVAGRWSSRLVLGGQVIAVVPALILAGLFAAFGPVHLLFANPIQCGVFVLSVVVLAQFALADSVLIGLRFGRWSAVKNTFHAAAKLIVVVLLAGTGSGFGILVGWMVPALLSVVVVELLLFGARRGLVRVRTGASELPGVRALVGYFGSSLGWMLGQIVPGLLIPVFVAHRLGLTDAAYFNIAWTIVAASILLMSLVTGPFVSEASDPGADLRALTISFVRMLAIVSVLRAAVVGVLGPIALYVYGEDYGDNATRLLLIMAVCHLIGGAGYLYGALARVYRRVVYPMVVQIVGAVLVVVLSWVWLGRFGIDGVAWAFLVHDVLIAVAAAPPLVGLARRALAGRR